MKSPVSKTMCKCCALKPIAYLILATLASPIFAQDVGSMSLEDLLNADVSTVSRKTQRLSETAASVFVLTGDEIQRSGATSIPAALRLVPGLQVAQMGNARWAVTSRGFNGRFANKLLVLMDGRSIYSPLFSGVMWEQEDALLEDIDRIEVIRGPGAAMWGANAVNGVINIITKRARATQGGMVALSGGTEERVTGAARWGGAIDETTHYRVWAKGLKRDATDDELNVDDSRAFRAGFRLDKTLSGGTRVSAMGETYQVRVGDRWDRPVIAVETLGNGFISPSQVTVTHAGSNILGRIDTVLDNGAEVGLQSYFEHSRLWGGWALSDRRDTIDLDFQYRLHRGAHDMMWGAGYRNSRDYIEPLVPNFVLARDGRSDSLYSMFIHDEWTLVPERFKLIAGAKFEHNPYTGFELQPNVRFTWTPNETQTVWGALSRAVRTPAQAEEDASITLQVDAPNANVPLYNLVTAHSSARLSQPETVNMLELGYRQQVSQTLSVDVAAFAAHYDDLRMGRLLGVDMQMLTTPFGVVPYLQTNIETAMGLKARTHGLELVGDWRPVEAWRLVAAYTYQRERITDDPGGISSVDYMGKTPHHSASLRSSYNLGRAWQLDASLRHVGKLEGNHVPGYNEMDARIGWRVSPAIELSLVGQNLLHRRHLEWVGDYVPTPALQIERSWFVKAKLTF